MSQSGTAPLLFAKPDLGHGSSGGGYPLRDQSRASEESVDERALACVELANNREPKWFLVARAQVVDTGRGRSEIDERLALPESVQRPLLLQDAHGECKILADLASR
jgi:hypothetical protein